MRIRYNVDRNILIQYDYQLTHYDRRECLCAARKFFKPAGTLCPLASKRLYNLVAAGNPSLASLPQSLHHHAFHELSFMARDNLAVPASGCVVKRQFSISRRIVSLERSRLKGETISDSMMFKAGLMRKGLELREMDIAVYEDHDWSLAIPL